MKTTEIIKRAVILLMAELPAMDKKELIDAIAAGSKLTKADAGKLLDTLPIKSIVGIGLISGMNKTKLIDAITAGAKLSKADAG